MKIRMEIRYCKMNQILDFTFFSILCWAQWLKQVINKKFEKILKYYDKGIISDFKEFFLNWNK